MTVEDPHETRELEDELSVHSPKQRNVRLWNAFISIICLASVTLSLYEDIYGTHLTRKALCITGDPTHPSHSFFSLLPSGRRLRSLQARTSRLKDSFIHQAVRKLNSLPNLPPLPSSSPGTIEL